MSDRRARNTQRIKGRILAAARTLIEADGVEFSMSGVANTADVAEGTVYNHFPSKDALLVGVWDAAARDTADNAEPLSVADVGWERAVRSKLARFLRIATLFERATMRQMMGRSIALGPEYGLAGIDERLVTEIAADVQAGIRAGFLRDDVCVEDAAEVLFSIVVAVFLTYLADPSLTFERAEQRTSDQVGLVLRGLGTAGGETVA